ncbi:MAG: hypothetical protein NVV74_02150 [Magnetospirillum sp.]|nr:hypothetical protein [Magnetospirillum sp.]
MILALLPDLAVKELARWARATWYWDLCYAYRLRWADDIHVMAYSDVLRLLVGDLGLLWPPLCAFAAAVVVVALPLWLGAMARGFEAGQGSPTWGRFLAALLPSLVFVPLGVFGVFAGNTGLSHTVASVSQPPGWFVALFWLVLPIGWSMLIARLANVGVLLVALLSGRRRAIEW